MNKDKRKGLERALAYIQQGKLDRAFDAYQTVLKADPADSNVLNALGDLCARMGNKAEAITYFMRLGGAYRDDGLTVRAIAVYKKVLKLDPSHTEASLACADQYAEQGLRAEAKQQFQGIADHYLRRGNLSKTLEIYEKMIRVDPAHRPTLSKVAGILTRPGGVEESLTGLNSLGERLLGSGHAEVARQLYEAVVDLFRSHGREAEATRAAEGLNAIRLAEEEAKTAEVATVPSAGEKGLIEAEEMVGAGVSADFVEESQVATMEMDTSGGAQEVTSLVDQVEEVVEVVGSQTLTDELQEAEFFVQQGMMQEAQSAFQRILVRDPEHTVAKQKLAEIERKIAAPAKEKPRRPAAKKDTVFKVADTQVVQGDFIDLAGELNEELALEEKASSADIEPEVQDLLHQFQAGVREQIDVTDYETHYHLGIAYKDLGLYDEAIEELRLAASDAANRVRCAGPLGLTYLAKGEPEQAVEELLEGLAATQNGTEERWGVLYDLATAYEALGDAQKALEALQSIHSESPKFRDIRTRVRDLRGRLGTGRESVG
ncbi:MAG: tetratricopeptide repeat protein [Candidatus Methylomirabilales bacterium]|nr:tetratricopeptide repeat protein [candidate division NC10 bacterium]